MREIAGTQEYHAAIQAARAAEAACKDLLAVVASGRAHSTKLEKCLKAVRCAEDVILMLGGIE
jgi:hypothetical protein